MKKNILFTILGIILGICGTVSATLLYSAKDIEYKESNVQDAIDDLYSIKNDLDATTYSLNDLKSKGNATSSDILSGKTAVVNGNLITGTKLAKPTLYDFKSIVSKGLTTASATSSVEPGNYIVILSLASSSDFVARWSLSNNETCLLIKDNKISGSSSKNHANEIVMYECTISSTTNLTMNIAYPDSSWAEYSRSGQMLILKY